MRFAHRVSGAEPVSRNARSEARETIRARSLARQRVRGELREGIGSRRRVAPSVAALALGCAVGGWLGWFVETPWSVDARKPSSAQVAGLEPVGTGSADVEPGGAARQKTSGETARSAAVAPRSAERAERAAQAGALGAAGEWDSRASRASRTRDVATAAYASPAGDAPAPEEDTLSWLEVGRDERGVLAHARGRDRAAPRELALWRVEPSTGKAALLTRGRSRANGSFAFERLLVSPREVHLVVAANARARASAGPPVGGPASPIATLAPARLPPPEVVPVVDLSFSESAARFESRDPSEPLDRFDPFDRFELPERIEESP